MTDMPDNKKQTPPRNSRITTELTTAGRLDDWTSGVVNPPVYRASTCIFNSYAEMRDRVANVGEAKLFYGRKGTPTQWALAEALTDLHGGQGTMLFPSGVAALNNAILAFVSAGDHILVPDSVYDPIRNFASSFLKRMGVNAQFYDPLIGADIANLCTDKTKLILLESPGSLTFEIQDIPAITAVARDKGILTIADNTWATPYFFRPLEHGVDMVMEACTKYIGGHSDVMLGSVTANKKTFLKLRRAAYQLGQICSADDAFLGSRGLRTLGVRLKQHQQNALTVATWLQTRREVAQVLYPALPDDPGHALWQRDFDGASGLFSIILKAGSRDDTAALVDGRKLFKMGFSWGGFESLILPADPTPIRSARPWQADGALVRLHIGLEDPDDLIADLEEGLNAFAVHMGL